MEYTHINDCWNAIENAKSKDEVKKLFRNFPIWSGDWEIYVEDKHYVVENTWYDEDRDSYDQSSFDLSIPLDDEDEDDDIEIYFENGIPQ